MAPTLTTRPFVGLIRGSLGLLPIESTVRARHAGEAESVVGARHAGEQVGQVAQLVEQRTENPRVGGSIPPLATILFNNLQKRRLAAFPFCVSFAWVCVSS